LLGGDVAPGGAIILDDQTLSEFLADALRHEAGDRVGSAAGGIGDDELHRPRREAFLRDRAAKGCRNRR
jgi:hypothetical protein